MNTEMERQLANQLQSTEEFAVNQLVKAESVRSRYCKTGSYFGVIPKKLANGRLAWPSHSEGFSSANKGDE